MGSLLRDGDGFGCYPRLSALRKNGSFWGYALLFGGLMGPLWSLSVDMGSLVGDGDKVGRWVV